jgi:hypothetical protein
MLTIKFKDATGVSYNGIPSGSLFVVESAATRCYLKLKGTKGAIDLETGSYRYPDAFLPHKCRVVKGTLEIES